MPGRDEELSPDERAAFDALPRESEPSRLLEERTVRALRAEGLLGATSGARAGAVPRAWWAAGLAASLALFAGGVAVGQALGARTASNAIAAARAEDARVTAALVQQTGSAYVAALSAMASADTTRNATELAQAREAALVALRAATDQLARLDPQNATVLQVQRVMSLPAASDSTRTPRHVVWY